MLQFSLVVSVYLTQVFLFGQRMVLLETFFHLTLKKSMTTKFMHLSVISLVLFNLASVETVLLKNTYTVGLPPRVESTIASYYLHQHYQSMHSWSTHRQPTNDCKGALILVFIDFMPILYNLVPRMLILPYTGQRNKVKNIVSHTRAVSSAKMKVLQEFMNKTLNTAVSTKVVPEKCKGISDIAD